jgi:hypothetical protein
MNKDKEVIPLRTRKGSIYQKVLTKFLKLADLNLATLLIAQDAFI